MPGIGAAKARSPPVIEDALSAFRRGTPVRLRASDRTGNGDFRVVVNAPETRGHLHRPSEKAQAPALPLGSRADWRGRSRVQSSPVRPPHRPAIAMAERRLRSGKQSQVANCSLDRRWREALSSLEGLYID